MFIKRVLLFFSIIFCFSLSYTIPPGSQLWYSGFNAGIAGQGFGGIASKYSGFSAFLNPATSATTENIRFVSSGNISSDSHWGGTFGISSPIQPGGVLYAGTQFLSFDGTSMTQIGYGKKVRSDLAFGMEGIITIHPQALQNSIGGGFSLGVLWLPQDLIPIKNHWGLIDFSLGGTIKTIFYPTGGTCLNPMPEMLFQIGTEATIMQYPIAKWKMILDYSLGFVPLSTRNQIHLQTWMSWGNTFTLWDIWDLSAGLIMGNHGLGFGSNQLLPFTIGTAIGYGWEHISFKVTYAFAGQRFFDKTEYLHTIGLELGIGSTKKPTNTLVSLHSIGHENLTNYFSPNDDGIQDTITFIPTVPKIENLDAWRITIIDQEGRVIRSLEDQNQSLDSEFTIKDFFVNYFVPTSLSSLVPQEVIWDGENDKNITVAEGTYQVFLQIRYQGNKTASSMLNTIIVDTTKSSAKLLIKKPFLYLGDDPSQKLIVEQELSPFESWTAQLIDNETQKEIEQWSWDIQQAPLTNQWGLKNPKRINVATGAYTYLVRSQDKAGNTTEEKITNIMIETDPRKPHLKSENLLFSPNGDNYLDEIIVTPDYSSLIGLKKSCLVVYAQNGEKIYSYAQHGTNYADTLEWKGTDNNSSIATDGQYLIVLEQHYEDNKQINSVPLIATLDITPPEFSTIISPNRFSPDGDEIDDILKIDFSAQDLHNISNWIITIKNEKGNEVHKIAGAKDNQLITWAPSKKYPFVSRETLYLDITIQDQLGNKTERIFHTIPIDLLTETTDPRLIITTQKAYFDESFGVLSGDIFPYLEEVWDYYQHEPQDHLKILVQSYFAEANNSQNESYKLALTRGSAIQAYLINKGVNKKNISVEVKVYNEKNPQKQKDLRQTKIYIKKYPSPN